jgi:hypothetical protein
MINWNLQRKINDDKVKWYQVNQTDDKVYMYGINCFICGKRIVGEMETYGNYYVHKKCMVDRYK